MMFVFNSFFSSFIISITFIIFYIITIKIFHLIIQSEFKIKSLKKKRNISCTFSHRSNICIEYKF